MLGFCIPYQLLLMMAWNIFKRRICQNREAHQNPTMIVTGELDDGRVLLLSHQSIPQRTLNNISLIPILPSSFSTGDLCSQQCDHTDFPRGGPLCTAVRESLMWLSQSDPGFFLPAPPAMSLEDMGSSRNWPSPPFFPHLEGPLPVFLSLKNTSPGHSRCPISVSQAHYTQCWQQLLRRNLGKCKVKNKSSWRRVLKRP